MEKSELVVKDLGVEVDGKKILDKVNLSIKKGEVVALMGPNGSGKSTLSFALMGHPKYKVLSGEVLYKGEELLKLRVDERSRLGLFLSFQYPQEIAGVTLSSFLRNALSIKLGKNVSVFDFAKILEERMKELKMDKSFTFRYLNEGFSGGEKKKAEILQLSILEPEIAILDETDSGLDVEALKVIGEGVNRIKKRTGMGVLIITHYQRILKYIKPDRVYIMSGGRIVKEGGRELVKKIEKEGYGWAEKEYAEI